MTVKWTEKALGEVIELKRGFDLPQRQRQPGEVPVVSSSGISGRHSEAKVKGPGVVTGRYGTIGKVFYIADDFWPLNTTLYVEDFKGNDPRFVSYFLRTFDFLAYSDKAAVPGVNRNHLHTAKVLWPTDVNEQRTIAHILGTLDDKIELNQRMKVTLENIAHAIFKLWFFDFEPVRAKAKGELSEDICYRLGLTPDLLELFPISFQDSTLGEIPKGWETTELGNLCSRVAMGPFGSDIKTSNFQSEGVPVIRGGNLRDGFLDAEFVFISEAKADELRNANAKPEDIVITHRGTLGQVGIIPRRSRFPRYVVSQSQMVLAVDRERSTPRFVYEFLRSVTGQQLLLANTSQVGVPAIARPTNSIKSIPLVAPPREVAVAFETLVEPLFDKITLGTHESDTLTLIRDSLLPKLLSGELPVGAAQ